MVRQRQRRVKQTKTHRKRCLALNPAPSTQMLGSGIDLRTAAGRLDHASGGRMTLSVYAHRTRPTDQRTAQVLAEQRSLPHKARNGRELSGRWRHRGRCGWERSWEGAGFWF